jgi:hypothetical protein
MAEDFNWLHAQTLFLVALLGMTILSLFVVPKGCPDLF